MYQTPKRNSFYITTTEKKRSLQTQGSLLSTFRKIKPRQAIQKQQPDQNSFFCSLISKLPLPTMLKPRSQTLCHCNKNSDGYCTLVLNWIEECYDWRSDKKFIQVYLHYNRKALEIPKRDPYRFNSIQNDIQNYSTYRQSVPSVHSSRRKAISFTFSDFETDQYSIRESFDFILQSLQLQDKISQPSIRCMMRVLQNYVKHTIYYGKYEQLIGSGRDQSKIFIWLAVGIYYHIGPLNFYENPKELNMRQAMLFWSLDIIMNKLKNVTNQNIKQIHCKNVIILLKDYFPDGYQYLKRLNVDVSKLIQQWFGELLCGYMDIKSLGFYVDMIGKLGWNYIYKVFLSYLEKRIQYIRDKNIKQQKMVFSALIDSQQQWPMIFCNATTFSFET